MKEIDDTTPPESESEEDLEVRIGLLEALLSSLEVEFAGLHHDVALLLEQRETVRAPECQEDPEWYA